ncbi:MAG: 4'-phosphopantetheinyl transferase superfamily protein [Bacteroidales bacterium]|nr:4'-phosphopantetheinyl transferase superfamily protein [Bacteroidales bacterium]
MKTVALFCGDIELPIIETRYISDIPSSGTPILILASTQSIGVDESILYAKLTTQEAARAMAYRRPVQRSAYILNHALLRMVLSRKLNISEKEVPIIQGSNGKPILDYPLPIHFNISDSDHQILIAFSTQSPIGADIEKISPETDFHAISGKFFSMAECKSIIEKGQDQFYRYWTRKEAALKACGLGITEYLHRIQVLNGENPISPNDKGLHKAFNTDYEVLSMKYKSFFMAFSSPKPVKSPEIYFLHNLILTDNKDI